VIDKRLAWAEQYLLQAFLAFNSAFEVVLPVHALACSRPDDVRRLIPSFRPEVVNPEHSGSAGGAAQGVLESEGTAPRASGR
jgi:hypothetical protein